MIKDYYTLTKPGIVYGNALTAIAGFVLASQGNVNLVLLFATLVGISLVIASGCVFNNYIDRDIDALMERTKERVLVRGVVSLQSALIYGIVLGVTGLYILNAYTNTVTVLVSLTGLFVYVLLYSMWWKRHSVHGALIGSISGAVPILVGYVAVTGRIDIGAVILFFILALWQMPHFFAIAIYRLKDYKDAGVPVLPIKGGIYRTKVQILIYTVLFVIATLSLTLFGYTGWLYFFMMTILGISFVALGAHGLYTHSPNNETWARKVFLFSIVTLVLFCMVIVFEGLMI